MIIYDFLWYFNTTPVLPHDQRPQLELFIQGWHYLPEVHPLPPMFWEMGGIHHPKRVRMWFIVGFTAYYILETDLHCCSLPSPWRGLLFWGLPHYCITHAWIYKSELLPGHIRFMPILVNIHSYWSNTFWFSLFVASIGFTMSLQLAAPCQDNRRTGQPHVERWWSHLPGSAKNCLWPRLVDTASGCLSWEYVGSYGHLRV